MGVRSRRPRNRGSSYRRRTISRKRKEDETSLKIMIYLFIFGIVMHLLQSCGIIDKM